MSEGIPDPHGGPAYHGVRRGFGERFVGALRLDADVYEEVEHDAAALGQAALVVAIAAFARGLGAAGGGDGLGPAFAEIIGSALGWLAGTAVIWLVGVGILEHTSGYRELLRTTGFASAPGIMAALGALPIGPLRPLLGPATFVLLVIAYVIAVRQALDIGTGRAIWVCLLAQLVSGLIGLLLLFLLVGSLPGANGAAGYVP
jgi:hypothetical protein